ncbi:MAG TPA: citryl-CoA lyase [Aestuariivirgaceae bacterium]|nr:citryl-CoA lyase [Aestuariivirgaceae bacterium]
MPSDAKPTWSTAVSDVEDADVHVRGYALSDVIGTLPFSAATFLMIRGRVPNPGEAGMMDAILCSVLDYALHKPGTVAARYCVSGNPNMVAGLATAMLSVGEYTLAPDDAGRFIHETHAAWRASGKDRDAAASELAKRLVGERARVPGFGHPKFRHTDPRAAKLKDIARGTGVWGEACDWYEAVHAAFVAEIGKPDLVVNEVGMMAAIMVEMGFTPAEMTGIAAISSLPGVIAHVSEELQSKVRIRVVPDDMVEYSRGRKQLKADLAAAGWKA